MIRREAVILALVLAVAASSCKSKERFDMTSTTISLESHKLALGYFNQWRSLEAGSRSSLERRLRDHAELATEADAARITLELIRAHNAYKIQKAATQ